MPAILVRILPLLAICLSLAGVQAEASPGVRETPLVRAVRECRKSVVNIHTEKKETPSKGEGRFFSPKERSVTGMGTGIVVDERGYIVTNYHVIHNVTQIIVTLDNGETLTAQPVSFDRKQDLAIIRVNASQPLSVMPLGTSSDVMLAEQVFAVGNAFGYEHTVTAGIVSHVSRDVEVDETQSYENLIQTDASINPGNSGGPLLNLDGEIIGINVAIRAGAQRIGFAIPIDDARLTIARLLSTQELNKVSHGLVGTDIREPDDIKLVVGSVVHGSPAAVCGLQQGDVIRSVRGITINDSADWERSLLDMPGGKILDVTVERDGKNIPLKFQIALGGTTPPAIVAQTASAQATMKPNPISPTQPDVATEVVWQNYGMRLVPLSERDRRMLPDKYRGGMKVMLVRSGGLASRHGIRNGDLLLGLGGYETLNDDNLAFILQQDSIRKQQSLSFQIFRNGDGALVGEMNLAAASAHAALDRQGTRR